MGSLKYRRAYLFTNRIENALSGDCATIIINGLDCQAVDDG